MIPGRTPLALPAIALVVTLVAACAGGTATPSATGAAPGGGPGGAMDIESLRVGVAAGNPPDTTAHYFWYAEKQGFYQKHGLKRVELQLLSGDQLALRALAANQSDVALVGCGAVMSAVEVGAPLVVISAVNNRLDYTLIAKTAITRPKDLEGKNLGVSAPGAVSFLVPKLLVEADAGDFSKVNVISTGGSSSRVQALINKTIDAAVLSSAFAARTIRSEFLHSLGLASEKLPDMLFSCHVAKKDFVRDHLAAVQAFTAATVEGARWGMKNVDAAIAISRALAPDAPAGETEAALRTFADTTYWNVDGTLPKAAWDYTMKQLVRSKDLTAELPYDQYVRPDLSKAATDVLGPYAR